MVALLELGFNFFCILKIAFANHAMKARNSFINSQPNPRPDAGKPAIQMRCGEAASGAPGAPEITLMG